MKKVLWDNYQIGNLIGEGVNGKVYKAYKNINGVNKYYAVKYISFPRNNHEIDDLIKRRVIKEIIEHGYSKAISYTGRLFLLYREFSLSPFV